MVRSIDVDEWMDCRLLTKPEHTLQTFRDLVQTEEWRKRPHRHFLDLIIEAAFLNSEIDRLQGVISRAMRALGGIFYDDSPSVTECVQILEADVATERIMYRNAMQSCIDSAEEAGDGVHDDLQHMADILKSFRRDDE